MNVYPKQFLSVLLTASFAWIFAVCILFCSGDADCAGESVTENVSIVENHESKDSCPIGESVKTIAPERISLDLHFFVEETKKPNLFSAVPVLSFVLKNHSEFYRPPEKLPPQNRPRILRI